MERYWSVRRNQTSNSVEPALVRYDYFSLHKPRIFISYEREINTSCPSLQDCSIYCSGCWQRLRFNMSKMNAIQNTDIQTLRYMLRFQIPACDRQTSGWHSHTRVLTGESTAHPHAKSSLVKGTCSWVIIVIMWAGHCGGGCIWLMDIWVTFTRSRQELSPVVLSSENILVRWKVSATDCRLYRNVEYLDYTPWKSLEIIFIAILRIISPGRTFYISQKVRFTFDGTSKQNMFFKFTQILYWKVEHNLRYKAGNEWVTLIRGRMLFQNSFI